MDNLIFDDNIKVSIVQTPTSPIDGDDVVFSARISIDNQTGAYHETSTYFFSYTWLMSNDGGNSFYQIGQDLDTLTINNISPDFFNNVYKVKIALVDLSNIILTEDGDNLTTQFGEVLLGNSNLTNLSVQSSVNDSIANAPKSIPNSDIVALNAINLQSVIDNASTYDTTINETTSAEVYSGQINIDRDNNTNLNSITIDSIPDPEIVVPSSVLSIQGDKKFVITKDKINVDCGATYKFDKCIEGPNATYESISDCPGCRDGGSGNESVTKFYINNLNIDYANIPRVAKLKNYKLTDLAAPVGNQSTYHCCDNNPSNAAAEDAPDRDKDICTGGPAICPVPYPEPRNFIYLPPGGKETGFCDSSWVYPTDWNFDTGQFAYPENFLIYFDPLNNGYMGEKTFEKKLTKNKKPYSASNREYANPGNPKPPSSPEAPTNGQPVISENNLCGHELGVIPLVVKSWLSNNNETPVVGGFVSFFEGFSNVATGYLYKTATFLLKTKYYNRKAKCICKNDPISKRPFPGFFTPKDTFTPLLIKMGTKAKDKLEPISVPAPEYRCDCTNKETEA